MRISDWSSDVCSSDLIVPLDPVLDRERLAGVRQEPDRLGMGVQDCADRLSHFCCIRRYERVSHSALQALVDLLQAGLQKLIAKVLVRCPTLLRSEEHTSELQSLMRISYAVFCLKKKTQHIDTKSLTKHK